MLKRIFAYDEKFRYKFFGRVAVFAMVWVALVLVGTYDKEFGMWQSRYFEGQPAAKDIFSPYSFSFVNEKETKEKKALERERVPPVFLKETVLIDELMSKVDLLFQIIQQYQGTDELIDSLREQPGMLEVESATLRTIRQSETPLAFRDQVKELLRQQLLNGLLHIQDKNELVEKGRPIILVKEGSRILEVAVANVASLEEALVQLDIKADSIFSGDKRRKAALRDIARLILYPNLSFNQALTQKRQDQVYQETQPVYDKVLKGEIVLERGQLILADDLKRLNEIEKLRGKSQFLMGVLGFGSLSFMVLLLLFTMLYLFDDFVFNSRRNTMAVCLVLVLVFLTCKVLVTFSDNFRHILLPIAVAPILVSILFRPRTGVYVAIAETILVLAITDYDPLVSLMGLTGGILGLYAAKGIRKRTQFLRIIFYVGAANFVMAFGYFILAGNEFEEAAMQASWGFASGIGIALCPVFIQLFEYFFSITTDIRLLELSDLNHPLLRRLVIEAPGTYHHSLVVSNLCENACEAIGANSLLGRVGSYFHDIGKLMKPDYFTENQGMEGPSAYNKHDKLSPSMSCLIIINHVKDGLELAKKEKLPKVLQDFIPQHQGTGLIYYFYHKALELAKKGEQILQEDFRYPGPKPQSRETGVILLADSVEAASRSLSNPTPGSIEQLVSKIITDKFIDNQLDECDLTLNDLRKIKESFIRDLIAINHSRIKYPEMEGDQKRPSFL